jgi:hypothetical protein
LNEQVSISNVALKLVDAANDFKVMIENLYLAIKNDDGNSENRIIERKVEFEGK